MRELWNWFGRSLRASGEVALAGAGALIDTIVRYVWLVVFTFGIAIGLAWATSSSWWFVFVAFLVLGLMGVLSVTNKGLWTIGFLGGLDLTVKRLPQKIKAMFPQLTSADFWLIRKYFRILLKLAVGTAMFLLLYSFLPVWEWPWLLVLQLLALTIYFLSGISLTRGGFLMTVGRVGLLLLILGIPLAFVYVGIRQGHFGQSEPVRWIRAFFASEETEISRDRSQHDLNSKLTLMKVLAPSGLMIRDGEAYHLDIKVKVGDFVKLLKAKPEDLPENSAGPLVEVQVWDEQNNFTNLSPRGSLPRVNLKPASLAEYEAYLEAKYRPSPPASPAPEPARTVAVSPGPPFKLEVINYRSDVALIPFEVKGGKELPVGIMIPANRSDFLTTTTVQQWTLRDPHGRLWGEIKEPRPEANGMLQVHIR